MKELGKANLVQKTSVPFQNSNPYANILMTGAGYSTKKITGRINNLNADLIMPNMSK